LRLGANAVETHEFSLVATNPDATTGTVRKRIDRLPEDDVRYFVLPVLAQLRVLLVKGSGDAGGDFFVSRGRSPVQAGHTPIQLSELDAPRLTSRDLEGVQVAVIGSDATITESQAQILTQFVEEGGGLLVLSGQRSTAEMMNHQLFERLGNV